MVDRIIAQIREDVGLDLFVFKEIGKKVTARAPRSFYCECAGKSYLLVFAEDECQDFYLRRAIEKQEAFAQVGIHANLNRPVFFDMANHTHQFSHALYNYYPSLSSCDNDSPVVLLEKYYECNAQKFVVTNDLVEGIKEELLSAWPSDWHHAITILSEFEDYFKLLRSFETIRLAFEHGDFTSNNILASKDGLYLMDFEFARNLQPVGFDIYDYASSLNKCSLYTDRTYYPALHAAKHKMINRINEIVDSGQKNLIVCSSVTTELEKKWSELYQKGGAYNLSPTWCRQWMGKYGSGKTPYIVTCWENSRLVLLAAFCVENGNLSPIGAGPDLYDQFGVLYESEKHLVYLVQHLIKCGLNVEVRFLEASSPFATLLMKQLLRSDIPVASNILDTKPSAGGNWKANSKERSDIKRLMNRAKKRENDELVFEYDVPRSDRYIKEFIQFHVDRWQGGPFFDLPHFSNFIEDLYYKSEIVCLSRLYLLKSDTSVAYHLGYIDSGKTFWSSIPSYNVAYKELSPGKVLLYHLIHEAFEKGFEKFDFGRGTEAYKYWFSNNDTLLLGIKFPVKTEKRGALETAAKKCKKIIRRLWP